MYLLVDNDGKLSLKLLQSLLCPTKLCFLAVELTQHIQQVLVQSGNDVTGCWGNPLRQHQRLETSTDLFQLLKVLFQSFHLKNESSYVIVASKKLFKIYFNILTFREKERERDQ